MVTDNSLDDLRPYYDDEIPAAMERMACDPTLDNMAGYAFPDIPVELIRNKLRTIKTSEQFQFEFVKALLENIVKSSSSGFTTSGAELINKEQGHLFISDHRDIVLDGALLQLLLIFADMPTSEITFGSNLISSPFVEDFGRSNKMYKIRRGGSVRDLVNNSRILSEHIHEVVAQRRGIWISQRDGRTKDGDDKTDQGLIKMLTMGSDRAHAAEALTALSIVPIAISYEYEPCDILKAREVCLRKAGPYEKGEKEDLNSIIAGVMQYKGAIHMAVCAPLTAEEICELACHEGNDMLREVAALIDRRIYEGYKLFQTNYIAYDLASGSNGYEGKEYDAGQREKFIEYLNKRADSITDDIDREELISTLLDIYANPVRNKLSL